jgi:hypothetical protein
MGKLCNISAAIMVLSFLVGVISLIDVIWWNDILYLKIFATCAVVFLASMSVFKTSHP